MTCSVLGGTALAGLMIWSNGAAAACTAWQKITDSVPVTSDPGFVRARDKGLHIAWQRPEGSTDGLVHTALSADCHVSEPATPIASGWSAINPSTPLIQLPSGDLRVFFAGIHSTETFDPLNAHAVTATAPSDGRTWSAASAADETFLARAYAAAGISAGIAPDETPVFAWGDSAPGANSFHFGIGGTTNFSFATTCCVYDPKIATDQATGDIFLGWFALATNGSGLQVQKIGPNGLIESPVYVPDSASDNRTAAVQQRIAIAPRHGGGLFVGYGTGYPRLTTVSLWRFPAAAPHITIPVTSVRNIALAASTEGRLWLLWDDGGRYFATRTNRQANKIGAIVAFKRPDVHLGPFYSFHLIGEGSAGYLDVLALPYAAGDTAWYHRRIYPGLSIRASARSVPASGGERTFFVTEAGEPIPGATVTAPGVSATTNTQGRVTLNIPAGPPGKFKVIARKPRFTQATLALRRDGP